jgi:hypothetical protein
MKPHSRNFWIGNSINATFASKSFFRHSSNLYSVYTVFSSLFSFQQGDVIAKLGDVVACSAAPARSYPSKTLKAPFSNFAQSFYWWKSGLRAPRFLKDDFWKDGPLGDSGSRNGASGF